MRIELIAAGTRMPRWVSEGYQSYARRLPPACTLTLREIPLGSRSKGSAPGPAVEAEGARMLRALPPRARIIALDQRGELWSTEQLSRRLERWLSSGASAALMVGGPDGLAGACLDKAMERWSLSPLTLPHGLVRVVVAEQIYRAWSIVNRHPYHRA